MPHLLVDPEADTGLCHDFLSEAISRFGEDESVKEVLVGAADELSQKLGALTMDDAFKPYILVSMLDVRGGFCWLPLAHWIIRHYGIWLDTRHLRTPSSNHPSSYLPA